MWYLMSWFKGNKQTAVNTKDPMSMSFPKYSKGSLVDMYCFISEKNYLSDFDMSELIWSETGIELAMSDQRNYTFIYEPSKAVQNNGSVYLHAVFVKSGLPINRNEPDYQESAIFGGSHNLIAYYPKPKNDTGVNLLSGNAADQPKEEGPREIIGFFKPNVSVQIVDHFVTYPKTGIPPQVGPYITFNQDGSHYPIVHFNEFWLLRDKMLPMNETVSNVTLHLDVGWVSMWWWQLMLQMEKSFDMQKNMGMQQDGESDELKRIFLEGNPVLLGVTMVVSMLHTVFDMLAFKNDIGFWKNNKSMEGLSARSVIINAVCQLVILLYLIDNETSMVVLFSAFIGTGIEFWKVTKAMQVTVDWNAFPYIKFADRASYTKSKTKQYDEEATRYLSYALYPLVIGYSVYTLMYKTHKSWYSWVLNTLVGAVYMFGFILMCPQLYLNYKLKSVAHLPWRQMTYKFLNTIIDDLFAFVIKMPILHRLSVFRDDVIFLIFLYQRWIYRVDKTRVNEFGWAGEDTPAAVEGAAEPGSEAIEYKKEEEDEKEDKEEEKRKKGEGEGEEDAGPKKRKGGSSSKAKGAADSKEAASSATKEVKKDK